MRMQIAQLCFQRYPSPRHVGGGDVLFGNPNSAMKTARRDLQTRVWPGVDRHFAMEVSCPKHGQVLDIAMNPSAESMSCAS